MHPDESAQDSDDDDYVPPTIAESSGGNRLTKRARLEESAPEISQARHDEVLSKEDKGAIWNKFQASVTTVPSTNIPLLTKTMVKIEKRYRFAGEDIVEVKEVPADSDEAKKWPVRKEAPTLQDLQDVQPDKPSLPQDAPQETATSLPQLSEKNNSPEGPPAPDSLDITTSKSSSDSNRPSANRPTRRKSKVILATPGSQKAKKLTTLDKSAMDWKSHIATNTDAELEANRRGGGYLEKVEFLQRVDDRKNDMLDANKGTKRRR